MRTLLICFISSLSFSRAYAQHGSWWFLPLIGSAQWPGMAGQSKRREFGSESQATPLFAMNRNFSNGSTRHMSAQRCDTMSDLGAIGLRDLLPLDSAYPRFEAQKSRHSHRPWFITWLTGLDIWVPWFITWLTGLDIWVPSELCRSVWPM